MSQFGRVRQVEGAEPRDSGSAGDGESERERHLKRVLTSALPGGFVGGNSVQPLRNGVEIFPPMLDAIARAERSIDFETFVYWHGEIARRFARALADAADRGVRVRVLVDAVGAVPMPGEIRDIMTQSPAEVRDFHPPSSFRFWEMDHRTHRKILVCDDEAFTGGVGIAEEWTGNARNPEEWRDTHFQIRGPAVEMLRGIFLGHWLETAGPEGGPAIRASLALGNDDPGGAGPGLDYSDVEIQLVRSTGGNRWTDIQTLLRVLLASAKKRIRIATGYFVPEPEIVTLLCDAASSGIEVEVLHPGPHTDHRIAQLGGESTYAPLLEAGVRIYRYQPTMYHKKLITVDGVLSVIGSANLNHRSSIKDDEVCLNVLDREFTATMDRHLDEDLERCDRVHEAEDWSNRSVAQRIGEWISRRFWSQF